MGHLALRIWDEAEVSGYTFPMCFGSGTRKRACEIMHETAYIVRLHKVYLYAHVAMYSLRALYITSMSHLYHIMPPIFFRS
jgi:hypothetical protein